MVHRVLHSCQTVPVDVIRAYSLIFTCLSWQARHNNGDSLTSSVFVGSVRFLQCSAKFGANRVFFQVERAHTYPHHHRVHPLLPVYIFFFPVVAVVVVVLLLPLLWAGGVLPIFFGNFVSIYLQGLDLTLPLIRPVVIFARRERQTRWWAALAQQALASAGLAAPTAWSDLDA